MRAKNEEAAADTPTRARPPLHVTFSYIAIIVLRRLLVPIVFLCFRMNRRTVETERISVHRYLFFVRLPPSGQEAPPSLYPTHIVNSGGSSIFLRARKGKESLRPFLHSALAAFC